MTRLEIRYGKRTGFVVTVLTPGVHALVGPDDAAMDALLRSIAGVRRDRREDVFVDGARPSGSPALRRSMGSLFRHEELVEADTVEAHVARALELLECRAVPRDVLRALGCEDLLARSPSSLSASEARALALSVALSIERPRVLALFEPLSTGLDRSLVAARLTERAASGAVVLCRVSSGPDAADVGATGVVILENGKLWRTAPSLAPWFTSACFVRTDDPRALSEALAADAAVTLVEWSDDDPAGEISVTGPDAEGTALAVLRASAASGAVLRSVRRGVAGAPGAPPEAPRGQP